ncbi:MAG: cytochrome c oxidase assembly protein, partial [Alphaproteobacteria bacterium]
MATKTQGLSKSRKRWFVLGMFGVVLGMNGLAYASVPAYRAFCQAVGFAGIPKIASQSPDEDTVLERKMTIRFNSDISPDLDWRFKPVQRSVTFRVGETGLAFFEAVNRTDRATAGTAAFNV